MSNTANYNIPLIDPTARFDGANDLNKMANAIDSALGDVASEAATGRYELPPATADTLGGVRIGEGVSVTSDGTISAHAAPYELPVASAETLGGVKVGAGFNVTADGVLSVGDKSVDLPDGSIKTSTIADGAVTAAKIADKTVTRDKLSAELQSVVDNAHDYTNGIAGQIDIVYPSNSIASASTCTVAQWGAFYIVKLSGLIVHANGSKDSYQLCQIPAASVYGDLLVRRCAVAAVKGTQQFGAMVSALPDYQGIAIEIYTPNVLSEGDYTITATVALMTN